MSPAGASRSVPADAPAVLQWDRRTEASLRRLAALGVVKLTPTPDGTAVTMTRQGRVALKRPVRLNGKREDLRLLQSLAARDCARVRATRLETADDVAKARELARDERAATKARTKADVERAKATRDAKRSKAVASCELAREDVQRAKGKAPPRVSPKVRARERVQMADAAIAAEFGRVPGALEVYRKSGGGVRWGGPRGVERFGEFLHDLGREVATHAPSSETTPMQEREYERAQAMAYRDLAIRQGRLDEAAEIETWLRENPRRRAWPKPRGAVAGRKKTNKQLRAARDGRR